MDPTLAAADQAQYILAPLLDQQVAALAANGSIPADDLAAVRASRRRRPLHHLPLARRQASMRSRRWPLH